MRFITKLLSVGALGLAMALATAAAASAQTSGSPDNQPVYQQQCQQPGGTLLASYTAWDNGQNPCCPQVTPVYSRPDSQSQDPPPPSQCCPQVKKGPDGSPGGNWGQGKSQCCPQDHAYGVQVWDRNAGQCCLQDHGQGYGGNFSTDGCYQLKSQPQPCQVQVKPCKPAPKPCQVLVKPCKPAPKPCKPAPKPCKPKHHKKHPKKECKPKHPKKHHKKHHMTAPVISGGKA